MDKEFRTECRTSLLLRFVIYLWAFPMSFIGMLIVPFVIASGGNVSLVAGVIEAEGGILVFVLSRMLPRFRIEAITVGHVILGHSRESLDRCRAHERIHVSQYERWGLLFPFLYLTSSIMAMIHGKEPYRYNTFEQEAFSATQPGGCNPRQN